MTRLAETAVLRDLVAERFGVEKRTLLHGHRQKVVDRARHVPAWALRTRNLSYPAIGAEMAGRDHTTAMNSVRAVNDDPVMLEVACDVLVRLELEIEVTCGGTP